MKNRLSAVFCCLIFMTSWFGSAFTAFADEASAAAVDIAETGGVKYDSLQGAINAVAANGTITLLEDIDLTSTVTSTDKSYTLDMNDHVINGQGSVRVYSITRGEVTLKNGTIKNGYGSGFGNSAAGGGMNIANATVTLDGMTITGNSSAGSGGGIFANNSTLTIMNSKITQNVTNRGSSGSGVYVGNGVLTLDNVRFEDNSANSLGVALCISGSDTATVSNCRFVNNYSDPSVSGNSIIQLTGSGGSFTFSDCEITGNNSYHTIHASYTNNTDIKFTGCKIYKNEAEYTGGIYINGGKVTLDRTVIRNNNAVGEFTNSSTPVGGVQVINSTLNMASGAIYDNIGEQSEANDLYIDTNSTVDIIAAVSMKDTGADLTAYVWQNSNGDFMREAIQGKFNNDNGYPNGLSLTAFNDLGPVTAEYEYGGIKSTIYEVIEAAKSLGVYPAEINLIPGTNPDGSDRTSFSLDKVTIDFPLIINMNGCTLNASEDALFDVVGEGSLTLNGKCGFKNGVINIKNGSTLTLDTDTESDLAVCLEDRNAQIAVGNGFKKCGKLTITLDDDRNNMLNSTNFDDHDYIYVIVVNGKGKIDPADITLTDISNKRVRIKAEGNDIAAVNYTLKDDVFVSEKNGSDDNEGIYESPVKTIDKALELIAQDNTGNTIRILDTVTVNSPEEWDGGSKEVIIKRYTETGDLGGASMVDIKGTGSLKLTNITIDGGSENGYTNSGSIINMQSGAALTLGKGATLQNNDVSNTGNSHLTRAGGAVYASSSNTIDIEDGSTITGCKALLGGGIYCERGTINMNGGDIIGNEAVGEYSGFNGSGGGIALTSNNTKMTMTRGNFSENKATYGGAVSLGTAVNSLTNNTKINGDISFEMSGGTFTKNKATMNGGAIFVQSTYRAYITEGDFTENECYGGNYGGGAIYVNGGKSGYPDGELWVINVLITDNDAGNYGGGIAGCGTSGTIIRMEDGSAIYNNTAGGVPCDISSTTHPEIINQFGGTKVTQTHDYFVQYMLDGTPYHWKYALETGIAFKKGDYVSEDYLDSDSGKILYTDERPSDLSDIKIRITNNYAATNGGGIGTNGTVYIGSPHVAQDEWEENAPAEFEVEKVWKDLPAELAVPNGKYPAALAQLNIWILTIDDNNNLINKIHNPMIVGDWRNYTGKVSMEIPDQDYIILEQAIYKDGRYVWSNSFDEAHKSIAETAIEDIMDTMYDGSEYVWSDDVHYSPFTSVLEKNANGNYTFTNGLEYGDLSVSKTVTGVQGDKDKAFSFVVTLSDTEINGTYGDMTFENGVAEFTLKDNETKTAVDLPAGIKYTVTEKEADQNGYITTSTGAVGKISAKIPGETEHAEASFVNENQGASISVTKVWDDNNDFFGKRPDSIKIVLLQNGSEYMTYELKASENWMHSFTGLPYCSPDGTVVYTYTVKEDEGSEQAAWTLGYSRDPEIESSAVTGFLITNRYVDTELPRFPVKISKVDISNNAVLSGAELVIKDSTGEIIHTWTSVNGYKEYHITPGTYTIEEITPPAGYDIITTPIRFTVGADGTVTVDAYGNAAYEDGMILVKDKRSEVNSKDIVLFKLYDGIDLSYMGESDRAALLAETKFELKRGSEFARVSPVWDGTHAAVTFSAEEWDFIQVNTDGYVLREVNAPESFRYERSTAEIMIRIDEDGTVWYSADGLNYDNKPPMVVNYRRSEEKYPAPIEPSTSSPRPRPAPNLTESIFPPKAQEEEDLSVGSGIYEEAADGDITAISVFAYAFMAGIAALGFMRRRKRK